MNHLNYYNSKPYAFKQLGLTILSIVISIVLILKGIRIGSVFTIVVWSIFFVFAVFSMIKALPYVLKSKLIFQTTDEAIIYHGKKIYWDNITEFLIYDTGIISVIEKNKEKPKNIAVYFDFLLNKLFFRGGFTINAKEIDVKPYKLVNELNERLDIFQGEVAG